MKKVKDQQGILKYLSIGTTIDPFQLLLDITFKDEWDGGA